jgi:hypothetical protein
MVRRSTIAVHPRAPLVRVFFDGAKTTQIARTEMARFLLTINEFADTARFRGVEQ